jgi:hypothetical protein
MNTIMRRRIVALVLLGLACVARDAAAQLDPLIYLKKNKPNVLVAIETSNRMQRDVYDDYLDANIYKRLGVAAAPWEVALGVSDANTAAAGTYRRKYVGLVHTDPAANAGDKFDTDHIEVVGDLDAGFAKFDDRTRLAIARRALVDAITANTEVARFSLFRTRQQNPRFETPAPAGATKWAINEGPVKVTSNDAAWVAQTTTGDNGGSKWKITRPIVDAVNANVPAAGGPVAPLVAADAAGNPNSAILNILNLSAGTAGSLVPGGRDSKNTVDVPLDNMLDDLKTEAARLIAADPECANTVAVVIVGGGEGTTTNEDPVAKAAQFLNVSARRVPIYVIGIAPFTAAERTQLTGIATASGGQFFEITAAMFEAAGVGNPIPELVRALNVAVAHGFASQTDFNKPPDASRPFGFVTEHQVTSPLVGTVNLENATDIEGAALPLTIINHPVTNARIPQRSNVLITAGFSLPSSLAAGGTGLDGKLRAMRVYKPVVDAAKSIGYRFQSDGTKLWIASAPAAASRNIYTALPDGTVLALTAANAAALHPYMRTASVAAATALIEFIRAQPLGAIIGSTPAIMDPPSLDPPPDSDYPKFINDNKNRRTMIWVGASDGMLHGIDARLGKEVWAFVPFNLLPKLRALQSGQPVGDFRYFVDGSPKVADVKVNGNWRTYLVMGEGAGGTFYQTFDVTLDNIALTVSQDSDNLANVLTYFSAPASVPLKWAFPSYSHFDVSLGTWGDVAAAAPAIAKTVGETWSDPAVGQIETSAGRFVVLTGSGFLKYSLQQQANRTGIVGGSTFYILDMQDGAVLDSRDVGNDNLAETVDNCAAANDCRKLKNALQADPVATGPNDSRFITKTYIGDLDGRIWRFDLGLDAAGVPRIKAMLKLYTVDNGVGPANEHPMFASMATVNVGSTQQYLFAGTGSDLLPQNQVNTRYALIVVLDQGAAGARTGLIQLEATDGANGDEKVSAFPAVAGDIVFFSTTTYKPGGCSVPDANLYAFTFIGGAAYDTNNSGGITNADSTKVRTTSGARATAPFIVDQHLVFGTGGSVEMFGDPNDFNNGVGQAGVRILSWREVR